MRHFNFRFPSINKKLNCDCTDDDDDGYNDDCDTYNNDDYNDVLIVNAILMYGASDCQFKRLREATGKA